LLAQLRSRLTYANVIATLALFVALGGSSYAAITITGKNVKDGSLTGKDVKNRSLATTDLSKKAVKSLTGKKGAGGARGAQGPQGAQGAPAPTNSITGANVVDNSLTTADFAGTDGSGTFDASGIAAGQCLQVDIAVSGARQGEGVMIATKAAIQNGVVIYGQRVATDGHVEADVCNFSGGVMTAINGLPIRVITFG
jgi:hypothetical protein